MKVIVSCFLLLNILTSIQGQNTLKSKPNVGREKLDSLKPGGNTGGGRGPTYLASGGMVSRKYMASGGMAKYFADGSRWL
jgi:hypothetical protein